MIMRTLKDGCKLIKIRGNIIKDTIHRTFSGENLKNDVSGNIEKGRIVHIKKTMKSTWYKNDWNIGLSKRNIKNKKCECE